MTLFPSRSPQGAATVGAAPVIDMSAIGKTYDTGAVKVEALREVDLRIAAGEFVAIVGPSGSVSYTHLTLPTSDLV